MAAGQSRIACVGFRCEGRSATGCLAKWSMTKEAGDSSHRPLPIRAMMRLK